MTPSRPILLCCIFLAVVACFAERPAGEADGPSVSGDTKKDSTFSSSTSSPTPASKTDLSIRQILDQTFDRKRKTCIQSGTGGWWVYELCPGRYIRQFHEVSLLDRVTGAATTHTESEHILGNYQAEILETDEPEYKSVVNVTSTKAKSSSHVKNGNGAYFVQEYEGGDLCDHEDVTDSAIKAGKVEKGGIYRAATIKYSCGAKMQMTVKEDSTCHYVVEVVIPALCEHPLFQAPVFKKQVIKCLPAES